MPAFLDALLANPLIALFATVGLGLALGQIKIRDISLGSSGVIFVALLVGHLGYALPEGVGTLGLILFVYCIGIGAGGRFFASFRKEGSALAQLSLIVVGTGAFLILLLAFVFDLPRDLAAGIFAGALTSTPALAAATEGLRQSSDGVSVGYGLAYPFGVIGVVLFVQLLPRLLKVDWAKESGREADSEEANRVLNLLVEVTNSNLFGKKIAEAGLVNFNACQISRVWKDERLVPLHYDDTFEPGQTVMLVGRKREIDIAIDYLGRRSEKPLIRDVENERQTLLATRRGITGQSLRQLAPLKDFGVVVTRITRLGLTFVPTAETIIETNDQLLAVGEPENLKRFAQAIGHRPLGFDETDLLSLAIGLTAGMIVGLTPIGLPGGEAVTLGMAGGPLLVGLLLGHLGRVGRVVGHIPRPTRMLLQELGLVLFLAQAGVRGGSALVETAREYGLVLFLAGIAVTLIPLLVALPIARRVYRLDFLQALGGICGGMTSTPALGAITARTDAQAPVVSYAAAYPVALILMTVLAKVLIAILPG